MSKRKNTQQLGNISAEVLAELTAEAVAEATAEAEQSTEQTEAQTEEQSDNYEAVTEKQLAELKAVAQTFVLRDMHFHVMHDNVTDINNAERSGFDHSVQIGQYGVGSNGKGELVSVWTRRKQCTRKSIMFATWLEHDRQIERDSAKLKTEHTFRRDYGIRFSQADFEMFYSIAECKALIDSAVNEHAEVHHNEPRLSFDTLSSATAFLAQLYNAYEKHTAEQTAEEQKSTEAEEQKQTEEQTTKQKSRSRKEQKQKA